MDIQLKRGMLDICVLSALLREDSYGYKIIKDLQPFVAISESTLYPILRRLEGAGALNVYSAEHNGRLRKYYAITPVGRERIQEFLNEWKGMLAIYEYIEGEMKNHD
ncbi:MAG: PadR family transcriptional regulator [Lachnospiraceae bacterium]|nr:PadR family transcriptional regulator [Lachnospiraceae bacterium]